MTRSIRPSFLALTAGLAAAAFGSLVLTPASAADPAPQAEKRTASADVLEFNFADPKGVNGLMFMLDSPLEPFFGTGTGLTGTIAFDPADPASASGTLQLKATGLQMTNARMTTVLHGADWINVEENPTITLALKSVDAVETAGDGVFGLTVTVDLTLKGTTRTMSIPVTATYLPGRMADRMRGMNGDLLVLRSSFIVKRKDFGIKPDMTNDVVANDIQITAAVVGGRPTG